MCFILRLLRRIRSNSHHIYLCIITNCDNFTTGLTFCLYSLFQCDQSLAKVITIGLYGYWCIFYLDSKVQEFPNSEIKAARKDFCQAYLKF